MHKTVSEVLPAQYHIYFEPATYLAPEVLFAFQVKRLRHMGFELLLDEINYLWQWIPHEPGKFFLVVPSQPPDIRIKENMPRMEVFGYSNVSSVNVKKLGNRMTAPISNAHLLLDVEDGRARCGIDPRASAEQILREGRVAYNSWQAIVHCCVFPVVLQHHALDVVGSFDDWGSMISLQGVEGTIKITSRSKLAGRAGFGAPSAGKIIQTI